MATYKVIQDIEAEDHILGPLTLRQFIFALISVFFFYMSFLLLTKGAAFLLILFLPPALFFGFFAVPFGRDQPTEVWALAKLRFWLKPRRRIWDQSGIKELVTITVPRKIERRLTDGLSQYEVKSRLNVLANTLDSRGWAVKNAQVEQAYAPQPMPGYATNDSDRLVNIDSMSAMVVEDTTPAESDMLDEVSSPVAQHFTQMIDESNRVHRQELISRLNNPVAPATNAPSNQWFMPNVVNKEEVPVYAPDIPAQKASAEEDALISKIKDQQRAQHVASNNLRTLQPLSANLPAPVSNDPPQATPQLTDQPDPVILSLASSDDLSVQTIANEAKKAKGDDSDKGEVIISLR